MASLVLLTLPLGNLDDLTQRQKVALETGHTFICEDTRNLVRLLGHLKISAKEKTLFSFHEQSEETEILRLIAEIKRHGEVFLVSDAGSPLISDPGFPLIRSAIQEGIKIDTYPGPSAPVVALELMGLNPLPFHFHGFFPRENTKRNEKCQEIIGIKGTHLFFESPYRVQESMEVIAEFFPKERLAIARELTKLYQSTYRFIGRDWGELKNKIEYRGEFVLGIEVDEITSEFSGGQKLKNLASEVLEKKGRSKDLAKLLGHILGEETGVIYQKLIGRE